MNEFSKKSKERLLTCHVDLQRVFNEVIKRYDCSIMCGHRGRDDQDEAARTGKSKLAFPNSKHNMLPSRAVDVVPYPVDWNDFSRFYHFAGYVLATARAMGVELRWGGDFSGDLNFKNDSFIDMPHWELAEEKK